MLCRRRGDSSTVEEEGGAQFVMATGDHRKQQWCAGSWDILAAVTMVGTKRNSLKECCVYVMNIVRVGCGL